MIYCPHCGNQITEDVKLCPFCGKSVDVAESNLQNNQASALVDEKSVFNPFIKNILAFFSSAMIIVGFFLSWITVLFWGLSPFKYVFGNSYNSYSRSRNGNDAYGINETIIKIGLVLMLASAIICFFHSIGKRIHPTLFTVTKIAPLLIILTGLGWLIAEIGDAITDDAFLQFLSAGFYLSFIAAIGLAFSKYENQSTK